VTGPIIIAIGLGLAPVAVGSCKANWTLALTALAVICICNIWGKGMIRIIPILIGLIVSYVLAVCMGAVDFTAVKGAAWIGFPVHKAGTILGVDFGNGAQIWSAVIAIVPIALATIMEHIGDISAISSTVGKDFIKDPGLHRTLTGDGLATTFASLFGGPANTTYGENTGVLALSRVFNPVVIRIAAVFAILLSFCPKFAALISTIPGAIVGGISFVLYGMISAVGIRNLVENKVDFSKSRNLIIAAVILVTALGGVTLPISIGKFHATLTPLALASLAGIVLNAIFPAGDYAAHAAEDEPPKGNTFEV
jgi:uracil permease